MAHPRSPEEVEATWERYPDASAALTVSRTPARTTSTSDSKRLEAGKPSPGFPVILPGEVINLAVVDNLRSGLEAGMLLPGPKDPSLGTIRVAS